MSRSRFPSLLFLAVALLCLLGMAAVDAKKKRNKRKKVKGQLALSCPDLTIENCAAYEDDCKSCALCDTASSTFTSTDKMRCCPTLPACIDYSPEDCSCTHCITGNQLSGGMCSACIVMNCQAGAYNADCTCNWCNHNNYLMDDGTCSDCPEVANCQEYKEKSCECQTYSS